MKEDNDINLQAKAQELIHLYLTGQMSEAEKEAFWEFMIENPQFHKELRLNASLLQLSRQNPGIFGTANNSGSNGQDSSDNDSELILAEEGGTENKSNLANYKYWALSMAAIVIAVIGFNLLKVSSPTDSQTFVAEMPVNLSPVDEIDIFHFESIPAFRDEQSDDDFVQKFDRSLIAAFSDEFETALQIYDELIEAYPSDPRTSMVYMNSGIIYYNMEQYREAIDRFEGAMSFTDDDPELDEKALWFIANSQLNVGEVTQAYANLGVIAGMQGEFMVEATQLMSTIGPYLE